MDSRSCCSFSHRSQNSLFSFRCWQCWSKCHSLLCQGLSTAALITIFIVLLLLHQHLCTYSSNQSLPSHIDISTTASWSQLACHTTNAQASRTAAHSQAPTESTWVFTSNCRSRRSQLLAGDAEMLMNLKATHWAPGQEHPSHWPKRLPSSDTKKMMWRTLIGLHPASKCFFLVTVLSSKTTNTGVSMFRIA